MVRSLVCIILVFVEVANADLNEFLERDSNTVTWSRFGTQIEKQLERDRREGLSYIVSGTAALIGGLIGEDMSQDHVDRGIYSVFQTIGVASIGYGAYTWYIGDDRRLFYDIVSSVDGLDKKEKTRLAREFLRQRAIRNKRNRIIRAVTHGLLGGLSFYSASKQTDKNFKGTFQFVGGIHTLAAISFTFDF